MKYVLKVNNNLRIFNIDEDTLSINDLGENPKIYSIKEVEERLSKLKDGELIFGIKVKNLKKMIRGVKKNE